MNILYVTSEVAGFAKTGGLADVSAALPRYLHRAGHDVRVFMPYYDRVPATIGELEVVVRDMAFRLGGHLYSVNIVAVRRPDEPTVYVVHCPVLYHRGAIYTNGVVGPSLADGERLTGNVMHDQFGSGKTLYTDNGASYVTMKNNVLADNDYRDWGTKQTNYALNANGPMDVDQTTFRSKRKPFQGWPG